MVRAYTDAEIDAMLRDRKEISTKDFRKLLKPRLCKDGSQRVAKVEVTGKSGRKYIIGAQCSETEPMKFSVRLSIPVANQRVHQHLIRCNGFHAKHLNGLDQTIVPANTCHIHRMTHRYHKRWIDTKRDSPEHYAEATYSFGSFERAVRHLCENYGIHVQGAPDTRQGQLFQ